MGYAARNRGTYEKRKAAAIERQEEERAARIKAMDDEMDRLDEERQRMLAALTPEQHKRYQSKMGAMAQLVGLMVAMGKM
jgi:hypothetical protein